MSDFAEFKEYVTRDAEQRGHWPGPWHWAPYDDVPAHEAICKDCGGHVHLFWDHEALMWLADGDLILMGCDEVIAWDVHGGTVHNRRERR